MVDLPFDSLLGSIEAGDIEAIAASIAPTEERAKSVEFFRCITIQDPRVLYIGQMRNILIFQT